MSSRSSRHSSSQSSNGSSSSSSRGSHVRNNTPGFIYTVLLYPSPISRRASQPGQPSHGPATFTSSSSPSHPPHSQLANLVCHNTVDPAADPVAPDPPGQHADGAAADRARGGVMRRGGPAGLPGAHDVGVGLLRVEQPDAHGAAGADAELPLLGRGAGAGAGAGAGGSRLEPQLEPGVVVPGQDSG